jgi:hypothetical protein
MPRSRIALVFILIVLLGQVAALQQIMAQSFSEAFRDLTRLKHREILQLLCSEMGKYKGTGKYIDLKLSPAELVDILKKHTEWINNGG